jgi:hypothetical protein
MWLALLSSQAFYLALLNVPGLIEVAPEPPPAMIRYVLMGMALLAAVASFALPRFLWNNALKQTDYRVPQDTARGHDEAALRQGMKLGMTAFILGLALNESVAIFGLVLGFLGERWMVTTPFFALAMGLMLARFPTQESFVAPLRARSFRPHG